MLKDIFLSGLVPKYLSEHFCTESTVITAWVCSVIGIALVAYLLGSLNFAIIISGKQYRQDIRKFGSKNAGMTNMMRTYGKKAAGLTLLGDALKAAVSCLVGYMVLGQYGAYIAGLFCIVGHVFPVYYRFQGGKGVVTAAVTILMCNPIVFLILFVIFAIIVLATKYISLGSIMCMLLYPIVLDRIERSMLFHETPPDGCPYVIFAFLMTVLIVGKHWQNIVRLFHGQESKFSFKKSVKAPEEVSSDEGPTSEEPSAKKASKKIKK
ncbi:MAG: glycerol-3-phosphate 1-O-acyltransferase PlsY [Ruminococcaceae bacterium]|nr:glycerol-3-phosphate 1-O-acyltransferase PlsY [Oscillospiraceae bacterium]